MAAQPVKNHRAVWGKTMFFAFYASLYCFRSRLNTFWGEELIGVKVLDEYFYNLISIKTK
jgi:hypothetical protein